MSILIYGMIALLFVIAIWLLIPKFFFQLSEDVKFKPSWERIGYWLILLALIINICISSAIYLEVAG